MATLTITTRGQVTFKKEVLQHLGIQPGEKIELDLLPEGKAQLKAATKSGSINGFLGVLAGKNKKIVSLEEMHAVTAAGWAGRQAHQQTKKEASAT